MGNNDKLMAGTGGDLPAETVREEASLSMWGNLFTGVPSYKALYEVRHTVYRAMYK